MAIKALGLELKPQISNTESQWTRSKGFLVLVKKGQEGRRAI